MQATTYHTRYLQYTVVLGLVVGSLIPGPGSRQSTSFGHSSRVHSVFETKLHFAEQRAGYGYFGME